MAENKTAGVVRVSSSMFEIFSKFIELKRKIPSFFYFSVMQEDFLHYIWKYRKFKVKNLVAASGEKIALVSVGQHNLNAGPDFFNAQIKIGGQLWAGNVEIHVKSSDWFLHNHEPGPCLR